MFYALAHRRISCGGLDFDITLDDIETLNQKARSRVMDISKLSFAAMGHLAESYGLLRSGAALGRGCGPLIISRPGTDLNRLHSSRTAVPGMWTTACLLLGLYLEETPNVHPMPFDQIMPAVKRGDYDFGVIIHEGRFTYGRYGLQCRVDLGCWWEEKTGLPLPLGGICVRRDIDPIHVRQIESSIRESIRYGYANRNETLGYIRRHAQEMSREVVDQHIDLYVNDFSVDLGDEGVTAVQTLFSHARSLGIIPDGRVPLFAC